MGIWNDIEGGFKWVGNEVNDVVDDATGAVKYGVNTGKEVIEHTENSFSGIISMPLLLIAGGVALFLFNSNAGQVPDIIRAAK